MSLGLRLTLTLVGLRGLDGKGTAKLDCAMNSFRRLSSETLIYINATMAIRIRLEAFIDSTVIVNLYGAIHRTSTATSAVDILCARMVGRRSRGARAGLNAFAAPIEGFISRTVHSRNSVNNCLYQTVAGVSSQFTIHIPMMAATKLK